MTKAVLINIVAVLCFVEVHADFGYMSLCWSPQQVHCENFTSTDYECNNLPDRIARQSQSVDSRGYKFYLWSKPNCRGNHIRLGPNCADNDCCKNPSDFSQCNFSMTAVSYEMW
uniref:BPTI/Kunitz inhibitor domain-containing protein n=1 Tax=Panagrellus redivivus TaxID=6233 RepID=A0A7E4URR0_PANRE